MTSKLSSCLSSIVNHIRTYSWNQPVLGKEGKTFFFIEDQSCVSFEFTTDK